MTLPFERTNALVNARQFMLDLMDSSKTPKVPLEIRRRARSVLKHFPGAFDISIAATKVPEVFGPTDKTLADLLEGFTKELTETVQIDAQHQAAAKARAKQRGAR